MNTLSLGPYLLKKAGALNDVDTVEFSPFILSLNVDRVVSTSLISLKRDSRVVLPCFCKPTNISFILSLGLALRRGKEDVICRLV